MRCALPSSCITQPETCSACRGFVHTAYLTMVQAVPRNSSSVIWMVWMTWEGASESPLVNALQRRQPTAPPAVSVYQYLYGRVKRSTGPHRSRCSSLVIELTNSPTKPLTTSPTETPTASRTATPTTTPMDTFTATTTETPTATLVEPPSITPTATPTTTPMETPTSNPTEHLTATPVESPSETPTATLMPTFPLDTDSPGESVTAGSPVSLGSEANVPLQAPAADTSGAAGFSAPFVLKTVSLLTVTMFM